MARRKSEVLLEARLEEAKRLDAEIRKLKNAAREKRRAVDEQRQKITGRAVLGRLKDEPDGIFARTVIDLLVELLRRPSEISLFPELAAPQKPPRNKPVLEEVAPTTPLPQDDTQLAVAQ